MLLLPNHVCPPSDHRLRSLLRAERKVGKFALNFPSMVGVRCMPKYLIPKVEHLKPN